MAVLLLAAYPALSAQQAPPKTVRIGNILPLSGPSSVAGKEAMCAVEMATEEINSLGGIKSMGGARLENVWADSASDPTKGMSELARLVTEAKVHLVSGAWNSAVTYPTSQAADTAGIPYLVPVSVRDSITERGLRYVFRLAPKDSWRSRDQFRFLADMKRRSKAPVQSLAFVFENGPWGSSMRDQWQRLAASEGYRVALAESYPASSQDLSATAMKVANAKPDVILLASIGEDAQTLAKAFGDIKVKAAAVVASGGGHSDPSFIRKAGRTCEYLFDVSMWEPDMDRPSIARLRDAFGKRCKGSLSTEAVYSYVSVFVIAQALEDAGKATPRELREALEDVSACPGKGSPVPAVLPQECIEFDRTGQNKGAVHVVVQHLAVDGAIERVTVWPPSAARRGSAPVFPVP